MNKAESNIVHQQRLRDRRKAAGWKRVSIWLSPDEINALKQRDNAWLGTAVKSLLCLPDKTTSVEIIEETELPDKTTTVDIIEETVPEPLGADLRSVDYALDSAVDSDYPLDVMREAVQMKNAGKTNKLILAMMLAKCGHAPHERNIGKLKTTRKDTLEHFAKLTGIELTVKKPEAANEKT